MNFATSLTRNSDMRAASFFAAINTQLFRLFCAHKAYNEVFKLELTYRTTYEQYSCMSTVQSRNDQIPTS